MKLLVVLAALVALVAGGAIPLVPGDNSHYVEGESRYVWVADGDGNPLLVDLHEPASGDWDPRNPADNQYWLFTRRNPTSAQIITHGNANTIWSSNYLGSRPLKVIVHGYAGNGNSEINPMLTSAWLAVMDANVIVVDWRRLASSSYINAVNQAPNVGRAVGNFITWLISTAGGNWNNVHFTGFSLGGQIAGNAGRATGGRPRRVTGLDPVSPMWYTNANAIGQNAGQYVEIIHTYYTRSNSPRIGHVDFYPNGGSSQPGCATSICSHTRSYHLFASTIRTNHLVGRQCANVNEAQANRCTGSATLHMGNSILNKNAVGFFGLSTGRNWPF
ncbi:pancreatic lipase-related protein 2-like [Epargyreus clarus]|uniref:pancreatic lipase-related protein 2-like n=1 Tax=Epargyreus clarus TaxID=520877 RepID=UPI003C307D62